MVKLRKGEPLKGDLKKRVSHLQGTIEREGLSYQERKSWLGFSWSEVWLGKKEV